MTIRHRTRTALLTIGACAASLAIAPLALATFPGDNGVVAFERGGDIWTVHSDGTGEHQLTSGAAVDGTPEWAPDGKSMLFTRDGNIWRMDADGSHAAKVLDQGSQPQISADGKSFLYLSPQGFNRSVRGAGIDGSGDHLVYEDGDFMLGSLDDWAPSHSLFTATLLDDDAQIVAHSPTGATLGGWGLGTGQSGDVSNREAAFSPDGAHLAFARNPSDTNPCFDGSCTEPAAGIATMDLGGGGLRTLNSTGRQPAWAPDGHRIVFITGTGNTLQMIRDDGSGKKTLAQGASSPDWQPLEHAIVSTPGQPDHTVTVTVQAPVLPPVVIEKVVTKTIQSAGDKCVIPQSKRKLTLTIRATRAINAGASVKISVSLANGKATVKVPRGKPFRALAR